MKYNPNNVNYKPILSKGEQDELNDIANKYSHDFIMRERIYSEIEIDFVHSSACIEGNEYNKIDTQTLLKDGITTGGKKYTDAVMIMNLRDAFSKVMKVWNNPTVIDGNYIKDIHAEITKGLLLKNQIGIIRQESVITGGSEYKPLSDPNKINEEFKYIIQESNKYEDPFEKAIYLHCNLSYLQPFQDGNKRTARMIQTAVLANSKIFPVLYNHDLIHDYREAVINYYENDGDYSKYVKFIIDDYKKTLDKLISSDPELPNRNKINMNLLSSSQSNKPANSEFKI